MNRIIFSVKTQTMTNKTVQPLKNKNYYTENKNYYSLDTKIYEIDYSEPLYFLRKYRNLFEKTTGLISMLETLQSVSYYYKNSNTKTELLGYISAQSTTNPEKALEELTPIIDLIPSGALISAVLDLILKTKKQNSLLMSS